MRRRLLAALATAALGAAALAGTAAGQPRPGAAFGRLLAEARLRAIADGDVAGALPTYQALVDHATGTSRAVAAAELGEALEALGRDDEARAAFRTALAADPASFQAAGHLARLGGLAGAPWGAPGEEATGGAPPVPASQGWEALLPPAERANFRAQVDRFARERAARSLYAAGMRMWERRERDRAVATLAQVVSQFPGELTVAELESVGQQVSRAPADQVPGAAALAAQAYRTAADAARSAPRPRPGQVAGLQFEMGEALMRAGDMAGARVAFREIMALGPDVRTPAGRSLAIPAEMRYREARGARTWQDLQAVQTLFGQGQDAQYTRGQPAEAAAIYRRIVAEFPESNYDGRALVQLAALSWFEEQDGRVALEAIDQVLATDRRDDLWPDGMRAGAWALFNQGRIREAQGDRPAARSSYRKLLEDWPEAVDHDGKTFAGRATQRLSLLGGLP